MSANKKTVFKGFDYMHCDDFARYLSDMAAKGWHFKEWGAGFVFEKGEPESATYAVEVFTKASENDTRPEPHTQEFAEYCEAAGWKLMDAKQKFCIFKKVQEDAVEILTPEERINNAYKGMVSGSFLVLLVLYGINTLLQWITIGSFFSNNIFSLSWLFNFSIWNVMFFGQLCRLICARIQKHQLLKNLRNGEEVYIGVNNKGGIHFSGSAIYVIVLLILLSAYLFALGDVKYILLNLFVIGAILALALGIAKFRPDSSTNVAIQISVSFFIMAVAIVMALTFGLSEEDEKITQDKLPLLVSDYRESDEEIEDVSIYHNENIFGGVTHYIALADNDSVIYDVYKSDCGWILDKIWKEETAKKANESITDCTEIWGAETAFQNKNGDYYVRYKDAIFILNDEKKFVLSQEQINIIRDKLDLR